MTIRYRIADWLGEGQRRAAAAAVYDRAHVPGVSARRTADGRCPLGVALGSGSPSLFAPNGNSVAVFLVGDPDLPGWEDVAFAATWFGLAWDVGTIRGADLAAALGVAP